MGRGVQLLFSSLKFVLCHNASGEEPLRADYKRINQFVLFVISLWILQVVLKFWRYLSAVDPARARVIASPRRRHAASQAAHNERAVRRLESGASD